MRLSFRSYILIGTFAVVLCTLLFSALISENRISQHMVEQARASLGSQLVLLRALVERDCKLGQPASFNDAVADRLGKLLGLRVTLITPDGVVAGDSAVALADLAGLENHGHRPEVVEALAGRVGANLRRSATLGVDLMYAATPIVREGKTVMVARVALPLSAVESTLGELNQVLLSALLLGAAFSLLVSFFVASRVSKPVRELTATATAIAGGDMSRRLRRYPPHEVGDLGRAFDNMADRLEDQIAEVTSARDRLTAILSGMVEGVLVTDGDGMIILANRALVKMLELKGDPVGCTTSEIIRNTYLLEAMRRARRSGVNGTVQLRLLGTKTRYLETHVVSLSGSFSPGGVVAVFHDVTEGKRLEMMRRDFVANVSHELRTPLTAIQGAVETMLDGALEDPNYARRFAELSLRNVERLASLVKDLMELSRIESGVDEKQREDVDATELAHVALETLGAQASTAGVKMSMELDGPPALISVNRHQIEQALINLLDNAVKYSESGGEVLLRVSTTPGQVIFQVCDRGPGIPPEHLSRLFERFYRVDSDRSRELGGTGLGLAIVKHIAQAHDGSVNVQSRPGGGSTFSITIPSNI